MNSLGFEITRRAEAYHVQRVESMCLSSNSHSFSAAIMAWNGDHPAFVPGRFISFCGDYFFWINFNGMSTCLGLFYAVRLANRVYCIFIFKFLCSYFFFCKLNTNDF